MTNRSHYTKPRRTYAGKKPVRSAVLATPEEREKARAAYLEFAKRHKWPTGRRKWSIQYGRDDE